MLATKLLFMQNYLLCLSQRQLCLNSHINFFCASPMEQLCWHSQQTYPKKNIKLISRITALGQEIISLESWFWKLSTILSFSLAENKLMFDYNRNVWTEEQTFWNGMNELNTMICVWAGGRELTKTVVEEKEARGMVTCSTASNNTGCTPCNITVFNTIGCENGG